ncbi:MAG: L,D-transpeptidase [Phenylobacterium sp.]|nr:L,D-transpeptidase [Phenylobacterium sp.]
MIVTRPSPLALALALALLALAGCGENRDSEEAQRSARQPASAPPAVSGLSETSNFRIVEDMNPAESRIDPADLPRGAVSGDRSMTMIQTQVLLDRARFSPGVIDGRPGENVRNAIRAYQQAHGMTVDGDVSPALLTRLSGADARPILRRYQITKTDVAGPFTASIPEGMEAQSKLERLGYTDPAEKLAEKFHLDVDLLRAMNPGADFGAAGTVITVVDRGTDEIDVAIARVEVDKTAMVLRAFAKDGRLLAVYPATIGSQTLPSPSGALEVTRIANDPTYHYDPKKLSFGDADRALVIAPGANNPVGSIWIALSRDGYGIHGTPEPAMIGKTASHGCVRLTNWDAEELGGALEKGATVQFMETGAS